MKKKLIVICTAVLLGVSSIGITSYADCESDFHTWEETSNVRIVLDRVTGIEYIVVSNSNGLAVCPRYNVDGSFYKAD